MSNQPTLQVLVGVFHWSQVRNIIRMVEFLNGDIRWVEGSGWLERPFIISGGPESIAVIKAALAKAGVAWEKK